MQNIGESGCGGLIATKDEDEGLGENLVFSQTCQKEIERELSQPVQKTNYLRLCLHVTEVSNIYTRKSHLHSGKDDD